MVCAAGETDTLLIATQVALHVAAQVPAPSHNRLQYPGTAFAGHVELTTEPHAVVLASGV